MGMFDTVLVPCPTCGKKEEAQTKTGDCILGVYELYEAPVDVIQGVNTWAPFSCSCGTKFSVDFKTITIYAVPRKWKELDES